MIYLIIVNTALLISFGLYHLCFRKLTFFQWNRLYLVGSILIALLIPIGLFVDLSSFIVEDIDLPTIYLGEMIDAPIVYGSAEHTFYLKDVLQPLYLIGVSVMTILLGYRLYLLRGLFKRNEAFLSFSFFNKVFLGSALKSNEVVESHEQVHVQQGHSYDVILIELVKIFNWFNPIVYLMAKELKFQHECIADEICSEDRVAYAELLVANAMRVDKSALVHEFSNHSFLKKRIMMLFKNKSSNKKKVFYLSTIPLMLVVAASTIIFNNSKAKEIVQNVEQKIEDVALPTKTASTSPITQKEEFSNPEVLVDEEIKDFIIQDTSKRKKGLQEEGNELFSSVEVLPEPPGGIAAFRKWISENYDYPQGAMDAKVKGTVMVSYIVEKDGSLSHLTITKDLGHGTGEAAVKLLEKAPKWSPGIQNGKPVRVQYALPIRLDLTNMEDSKVEKEVSKTEPKMFEEVEVFAEPKGGMDMFRKFIAANLVFPNEMIENNKSGEVELYFELDKEGAPKNFKVLKEPNDGVGKNMISVIEKYGKWAPAIWNGRKVGMKYVIGANLSTNNKVGTIQVSLMKHQEMDKS